MSFRHGLQQYIDNPENSRVVKSTPNYVIIRDLFPKAIRHFLVLPTDAKVTHVHPLKALQDPALFQEICGAVEEAKDLVMDELVNEGLLEADVEKLSQFRRSFIRAGVHFTPSMSNLHVHVITQDFYSSSMKNKRHYNSFTTPFFVDLETLRKESEREKNLGDPDSKSASGTESESDLDSDGQYHISSTGALTVKRARRKERTHRHAKTAESLHSVIKEAPLVCTYCGQSFGNRFSLLKKHLFAELPKMYQIQAINKT